MLPTTPKIPRLALLRLQYRQELHDKYYHNDIYTLPLRDRLGHLTLHHAKYIAYAATVGLDTGDRRIVDGIICCLSMLNACNREATHPIDLDLYDINGMPMRLLESLEEMAKTVEDFDHLIVDGGRKKLGDQVDRLLHHYLRLAYQRGGYHGSKDSDAWSEWVENLVVDRLKQVEAYNIFDIYYRNEIWEKMIQFDIRSSQVED